MMQNLSISLEEIEAKQSKSQILSAAEAYREELIELANTRLGNMQRSRQLVKTALQCLSKKQNLEKVVCIFRSWLHVYVNHMCDLQMQISRTGLQARQTNSENNEGQKKNLSPLRIVHQAYGELLTYAGHSSPAA